MDSTKTLNASSISNSKMRKRKAQEIEMHVDSKKSRTTSNPTPAKLKEHNPKAATSKQNPAKISKAPLSSNPKKPKLKAQKNSEYGASKKIRALFNSFLKQKAKAAALKKIRFSGPFHQQKWSFPDSLIYYICKNPSTTKVYQKMVKSCKYFYLKNPTFIIPSLTYDEDDGNQKWLTCYGKFPLQMKNISSKIWITESFIVTPNTDDKQNIVTSLIPKIFRCDVKELRLENQIISYQNFLFLASSVQKLTLLGVTVKYENGKVVTFGKLFKVIPPQCKEININSGFSSKTFKKLLKRPHFSTLKHLRLSKIPEEFDIETFYDYIKTNKQTNISLVFDDSISEAYQNRIEEIIDEMIETENHGYKLPLIYFKGLNVAKFHKFLEVIKLNKLLFAFKLG